MNSNGTMQGKVCLITGANSGIGKAAATELARHGATVVAACRNAEKGQATVAEIRKKTQSGTVDFLAADVSSQDAVLKLASDFRARYPALHVLINNAGLVSRKRLMSVDGIEMTFAVNHLAYFLLTNQLLDLLKASAPSRVVIVSSEAHRSAHIDFDDLQLQKNYGGFSAYAKTKLCNLLMNQELARRLEGTQVTTNALHPGVVATSIFREAPGWMRIPIMALAKGPEKGCKTMVYLSESNEVKDTTGKYFINNKEKAPAPAALDVQSAQRLWQISSELTNR
jgi:retinol dehydrogenase 12